MKSIVVLYHSGCPDGFGAAWSAWKKFENRADYIRQDYQASPPNDLKNKEIYLLDFSYKPEITKKLALENKKVVLIDHHISAKETSKLVSESLFSLRHSGSVLAWKYFHPKKPVPKILKYIEDIDLWRFNLPATKKIAAFLNAYEFSFKTWEKLSRLLENTKTRKECMLRGALIEQYENNIIKDISSSAIKVNFEGRKILAANCPILRSEIGHKLVEKRPPFSIVWREKGGRILVSLRSNGKVDVAKIAEKYGGGGHKCAAGFVIKKNNLVMRILCKGKAKTNL